ncbi:hypothetical protein C0992_012998 [Termitomyces sp. T32_za158]|nr:hypothetical protein C0992_012998 [Termitomyces sp. T32_za158]
MAVSTSDPLDAALRPPANETPEEREQRVAREEEASRVSQAIDASIKAEKQARKKKRLVRLLLLGQSDARQPVRATDGRLAEFQRLYTPTAFREERILWRAVIQLNIVRSIRLILDSLSPSQNLDSDADSDDGHLPSSSTTLVPSPLDALRSRLQPLRHIEALLIAKLVPPNEDEPTHLPASQEIFVRPGAAWKGALAKARVSCPDDPPASPPGRPTSAGNTGLETQDEPQKVLHQCRRDMILLWNDHVVRQILLRKKVRLHESPGL